MGNGCCGFDWFTWLDQWHHRPSSTLNVRINEVKRFRAPINERDINRGVTVMIDIIKARKVEVVKFSLVVNPPLLPNVVNICQKQAFGALQKLTVVRGNQVEVLENSYIVPKFVHGLLKYAKEEKKGMSLTHISLPMFGVSVSDKEMLIAIVESIQGTSIESLRLENVSEEGVLILLIKQIVKLLEGKDGMTTNLKELLIIYEMDRLSDKLAQSVHALILTDKLTSIKLSRNKTWQSSVGKEDVETGVDDRFTKYVARALVRVHNLKRLDLSNNHITDLGAKYLHSALYKNKQIRLNVLFLAKNLIDDSAIGVFKELTKNIRDNSLRYLDFSMNRIKERTFIELMKMTEKTLRLEKINLTSHDLNLDMYRLKHGTMLRTNENRRHAPRPQNNRRPYPDLEIQLASNANDALPYPAALPSWLLCGVCCLLKGPGHGDHLSLDNLIQGNLLKRGRSGYAGSLFALCLGAFLFFFSFAFPYVIMSSDAGVNLSIKAGLCLTVFLTPLFAWMGLIIFAAWRDPSGQWKRVSNPSFGLRCAPKNMLTNFMALFAIVLDFLQLISVQFQNSQDSDPNKQIAGGQINQYMDLLKLEFGRSAYEIVLYVVACIVAIWWFVAVFVISSLAVKKPENALKFPAAPVTIPLLSNALFLVLVTNLLKALHCVYVLDPLTGLETSYLFETCEPGSGGAFNCGRYVMVCWQGRHRIIAIVALVALVLYLISAPTVGTFFSEDYSGEVDIKFIPVFSLFERFLKLFLSVIVIFISKNNLAEQIISLIIILLFFLAVVIMQPSQHVRWVNFLRAGLYAIVFWAGLCNLVAAGINDSTNSTPVAVLLVGWIVIVFFALFSMLRGCMVARELREGAEAGPKISHANLQHDDPPVAEEVIVVEGSEIMNEIEGAQRPSQIQAQGAGSVQAGVQAGGQGQIQGQGPGPVPVPEPDPPVELRREGPSLGGRIWNQIRKPVEIHLPARPISRAGLTPSIKPSIHQEQKQQQQQDIAAGGGAGPVEHSITQPGEQNPPEVVVGEYKSTPELGGILGGGLGGNNEIEPGKEIESAPPIGGHYLIRKSHNPLLSGGLGNSSSNLGIGGGSSGLHSRKPSFQTTPYDSPQRDDPEARPIMKPLERGNSNSLLRGSMIVGVEIDRSNRADGIGSSWKPVLESNSRDDRKTRVTTVTVSGGGGGGGGDSIVNRDIGKSSILAPPSITSLPPKKIRASGQFAVGLGSPSDGPQPSPKGGDSVSYAIKDVSRTGVEEKKNRITTPLRETPQILNEVNTNRQTPSARSDDDYALHAPRKHHGEHKTPDPDGMDLKLSGSDGEPVVLTKDDPGKWFDDVLKPGDYVVQPIELDDLAEFGEDEESEEAEKSDRKQPGNEKEEGGEEEEAHYEALVFGRYGD